jgi:hypothetical protein
MTKYGTRALLAGLLGPQTHSECVILIAFHGNNGYKNASECRVIRTLFFTNTHNFTIIIKKLRKKSELPKTDGCKESSGRQTKWPCNKTMILIDEDRLQSLNGWTREDPFFRIAVNTDVEGTA